MRLSSIFIHPLKSGAPLALTQATIDARGLAHDRRWMVTDPEGRFVSGRQLPCLVRIAAQPQDDGLWLTAAGLAPCFVPTPPAGAPRAAVRVWNDSVNAACAGPAAAAWLSMALQRTVRLVFMDTLAQRAVDPAYAQTGDQVGFADGFPLLLIGQSSVDALNARLPQPVPIARFRPNLVVEGATVHAEDHWQRVRIGALEIELVKPCTRCVFTAVDPASGQFDPSGQPLAELKSYRRTPQGVVFGMNAIARGGGVLRVGDQVTVLA